MHMIIIIIDKETVVGRDEKLMVKNMIKVKRETKE
jgi:hypothetical protein